MLTMPLTTTRKNVVLILTFFFILQLLISHFTLVSSTNSPSNLIRRSSTVDDESPPGRINYSAIYHHTTSKLRPVLVISFLLWLIFLFSFVGIVASDFFCPNLATISSRLGLSESLAGVTFLGFGNGAPDVFSTFAAMKSNTGSLAIGELIGAASFIVSVVVGSMSLIRPFRVPRHSFLRDLGFFTMAIAFVLMIIKDGRILRWEANALVGLYIIYVLTVGIGTWYFQRKQQRRDLVRKVRSEFSQHSHGHLASYSDDPDFPIQPIPESDSLVPCQSIEPPSVPHHRPSDSFTRSNSNQSFKTLLETSYNVSLPARNRRMRAPSLSYRAQPGALIGFPSPPTTLALLPQHQPGSSSSVSSRDGDAPQLRRRNRTGLGRSSIRPSLLGAIEFRDVVNSLTRESVDHLNGSPTANLSRSTNGTRRRSGSLSAVRSYNPRIPTVQTFPLIPTDSDSQSSGVNETRPTLAIIRTEGSHHHPRAKSQSAIVPPSPPPWELDNFSHDSGRYHDSPIVEGLETVDRLSGGRHDGSSQDTTPKAGPTNFHNLAARDAETETGWCQEGSALISPKNIGTNALPDIPSIMITAETGDAYSLPSSGTEWTKATSWGDRRSRRVDCRKLAEVLWNIFFPSLREWKKKSHLGRVVALISAPAILVLSLTLPVVDDETEERDDSDIASEEASLLECEDIPEDDDMVAAQPVVEGGSRSKPSNEMPMGELRSSTEEMLPGISVAICPPTEDSAIHDGSTARWLAVVQCILAPPFCILSLIDYDDQSLLKLGNPRITIPKLLVYSLSSILIGIGLGTIASRELKKPNSSMKLGLCFMGFIVSMVWILTIVNEVVGVLKCLGMIFGLSDAILGLTVFGIGNSLGDLVANVTVARMGFPVMAMSACFGGPMLNVLIGIGLSSSYLIGKNREGVVSIGHSLASKSEISLASVIEIDSPKALMVSTIGLLIVLGSMMVLVPMRGYLFDQKIGLLLIGEYLIVLGVNILVEVYGTR